MRNLWAATCGWLLILLACTAADAQTTEQTVGTFQGNSHTAASSVVILGYNKVGDGGGGTFANPNLISDPTICMTATGDVAGGGVLKKVSPFPLGLAPGMTVTATGGLGGISHTVDAYSVANGTITVTGTTSSATAVVFYFYGQTGGSTLTDSNQYCFVRVNSTYSQKEWGAYSDGQVHSSGLESTALQNWINSNQPHIAVAGNSIIDTPLSCPSLDSSNNPVSDGTVMQGPPPNGVGSNGQPAFLITAGDASSGSFSGGTGDAIVTMNQSACAISGVGLVGNPHNTQGYNIINATQPHNAVFNHSLLSGGAIGFSCQKAGADTEILDSSIVQSASDGIEMPCPNSKVQRNVISGSGGDAIHFTGEQLLVEDNVIEQSLGNGVFCSGLQLGVIGNYFDNNGKALAGTSNLRTNGCQFASIVGNQFHRGSAADEEAEIAGTSTTPTAQVYLDGANDSISMSGNVDFVDNTPPAAVPMRPDYDVELTSTASVSNFNYADAPTPQNDVCVPAATTTCTTAQSGIFGPYASTSLASFAAAPSKYLSGLTTDWLTNTSIKIETGTAVDSSNTYWIALPTSCTVDISQGGIGGLDLGTGQQTHGATYHFFVLAQGDFTPSITPQCIASTSTSPDFYKASLTSNAPAHVKLYGYVTQGSYQIMNVTVSACAGSPFKCPNNNPFGGLQVGDYLTDASGLSALQADTQITALNSDNVNSISATNASGPDVQVATVAGLYAGMVVGNAPGTSTNMIPDFAVIKYTKPLTTDTCASGGYSVGGPCIELTESVNGTTGTLTASGGFTITMNNAAVTFTGTNPDTIKVYNDRYRLIASVVTDSSSHLLPYHQDGDTFYLDSPVPDINNQSLTGTAYADFQLASVPIDFKVEALGRCVASSAVSGNFVHIFTITDSTNTPNNFPNSPGYSIKTLATGTAFPYRIYTDRSATIRAQASATSTLNCMTDGYVFRRSQ